MLIGSWCEILAWSVVGSFSITTDNFRMESCITEKKNVLTPLETLNNVLAIYKIYNANMT